MVAAWAAMVVALKAAAARWEAATAVARAAVATAVVRAAVKAVVWVAMAALLAAASEAD